MFLNLSLLPFFVLIFLNDLKLSFTSFSNFVFGFVELGLVQNKHYVVGTLEK